jgi:ubiquinone/menaquinone biosynthesis C-methylase UbiE
LNKATQKASEKKIDILLIEYDGKKLPFQSNHFNRVISCLVFHHLNTETKKKILAELHRTIISNGELYIADFGRSKSWVQRKLFNIIRVLDGFKPTEANAKGILPDFIQEAGFIYVSIIERFKTITLYEEILCNSNLIGNFLPGVPFCVCTEDGRSLL